MRLESKLVDTINGTVFVIEDPKEERKIGSIVLAQGVEEDRMKLGTVLNCSPFLLEDGRLMDPPVRVGDRVIYAGHAGAGATWEDDADKRIYRLVKWTEILARIKKDEEN